MQGRVGRRDGGGSAGLGGEEGLDLLGGGDVRGFLSVGNGGDGGGVGGWRGAGCVDVVRVGRGVGCGVERAVYAGGVCKYFDGLDVRRLGISARLVAGAWEGSGLEKRHVKEETAHLRDNLLLDGLALIVALKQDPLAASESDGEVWVAYARTGNPVVVLYSVYLLSRFTIYPSAP